MGLSYYFTFKAGADKSPDELKAFLSGVEKIAKQIGFHQTLVLDAPFDTEERRKFARRLTTGLYVQDDRLKGVAMPTTPGIWEVNPNKGSCHLLPSRGVILVITDEQKSETVFGFYQYPEKIEDIHGHTLAEAGLAGRWHFSDFVDSPDPRFRTIVALFEKNNFLERQTDEFNVTP